MEHSLGFPSGDWPLIEICQHRGDCIHTAHKSSEDSGLGVSPRIFLRWFPLAVSSVKCVHPCARERGWAQSTYRTFKDSKQGVVGKVVTCLLVLNP